MSSGRLESQLDSDKVKAWLDREHRKHSYLQEKLGMEQSSVAKMLSGRLPRLPTLVRLAALMECAVDDLLIPIEAKKAS